MFMCICKRIPQNRWYSGLCPLFGILNIRKHNVPETGLFPFSGKRWEAPNLLGPLEKLTSVTGPLKFRTIDEVLKSSDSKHYTPLPEPLTI
jgi:hypothetical protein